MPQITTAPPEELAVVVKFLPHTKQFSLDAMKIVYQPDETGQLVARQEQLPPAQGMVILADFLKAALVGSALQQQAKPGILTLN